MSDASKARIAAHFDAKRAARELGISTKEFKDARETARVLSGLEPPELREKLAGAMTSKMSDTVRQVTLAFEEEFREIRGRLGYLPI